MTDARMRPRSAALRISLAIAALLMFAGFFALGTWQVFRLQWKLALIERVGQRVHAAPADAPPRARWPEINAAADEYRHVRLAGRYLLASTTRVQASTERGLGYWLMTPLCTDDGVVMVNRGFVPAGAGGWSASLAAPAAAPPDACLAPAGRPVELAGLLRISEAGGALLRNNDAAANRWYARDARAIAAARGLPAAGVAPYFVDLDAAAAEVEAGDAAAGERPVGGMTVIAFPNNHLVYAVTWYALALMVAGAAWLSVRVARRERGH